MIALLRTKTVLTALFLVAVAFLPVAPAVAAPDYTAWRPVLQLGHGGSVLSVAFSPDGRTIASGSDDDTVRLWEAASGEELRVLAGHGGRVSSVAFSPDGRTIASGASDGTARLWDVATGRELAAFADGSWIVLTPEGFFNASEGGARHLNLVRGLEALSVDDRVYDALFRPDLVREALAGDPDGRVAAAAADGFGLR